MAMTKAEMEEHYQRYEALMDKARKADTSGLYREAVATALDAWEHIDGMMQYERRFNKREFKSIPAVDLTLRYAPLMLDFPSLDRLETLLKEKRRIERDTSVSLSDRLSAARALMSEAHRLWDHIERNPESREDELEKELGGNAKQWRSLVEWWERLGLLHRQVDGSSHRLRFATRMSDLVPAKCSACGCVLEVSKGMCLASMPCPKCDRDVSFVILLQQTT